MQGYAGQILYHYPRHPLIEFVKSTAIIFPRNFSHEPLLGAMVIFTDGSSNGRSVVYAEGYEPWVEVGEQTSTHRQELRHVHPILMPYC